jgi:aspartate/methionine/tyrosine aminotransferase
MHWAKTRQAASFNLANSGVCALTCAELGVRLDDLELSGPSFYGWPPLIDALALHLGVGRDRVCHAEGTSMANHLAMAALLKPGDEVLLEDPTYGLLTDTARYFGALVRRFPRRREDQFQPDLHAIQDALTPQTRLIILTNLHNPSSARIPDERLRALADLAGEVGAWVLVDEVYLDAAFDPAALTAHRLHDRIIATSSLTKVYGLSGLRCGWVVARPDLIDDMWRLNDLFGVIPAHAAERLSLLALQRLPQIRARSQQLLALNRERWNAFVSARTDLEGGPLEFGTVVFPRLREGSVERLCEILRERYETTVAPGHFFGVPDSFRVGMGLPGEVFAEGLRRLGQGLEDLQREG